VASLKATPRGVTRPVKRRCTARLNTQALKNFDTAKISEKFLLVINSSY
jgi:hypothetical protein